MAIHWEDNLITGVPAIDDQHMELFAQFDKLSKELESGGSKKWNYTPGVHWQGTLGRWRLRAAYLFE